MKNLVKIHFEGKDYIGQIDEIQSVWSDSTTIGDSSLGKQHYTLQFYSVAIREKDTFYRISDIRIQDISEIELYFESPISDYEFGQMDVSVKYVKEYIKHNPEMKDRVLKNLFGG
jgi:hypothetical protein